MQKNTTFFVIPALFFLLSACGFSDMAYEGIRYAQTDSIEVSFQEQAIPGDCSVFAHLLMNTQMESSGQDIATAMRTEAMDKGANLILIGMAREVVGEELKENRFDYYGPDYSYNFKKTWLGWKFGFDEWDEGEKLVGVGTDSWGNNSVNFQHTLLVQAIFLRCGNDR